MTTSNSGRLVRLPMILVLALGLILTSCSEETSLVGPEADDSLQQTQIDPGSLIAAKGKPAKPPADEGGAKSVFDVAFSVGVVGDLVMEGEFDVAGKIALDSGEAGTAEQLSFDKTWPTSTDGTCSFSRRYPMGEEFPFAYLYATGVSRVYIYNDPNTEITFWDNNRNPNWEVKLSGGTFDGGTYTSGAAGTAKFRKVGAKPSQSYSVTCPTDVSVVFSPVLQ